MNGFQRLRVLTVTVALSYLVLGASATASTARPLQGEFTGSGFAFSGNLTHLGLFTGEITSFVPTPTGGTTTATWTAANGDEVHVSSVFTVTGFNPATGLFTFSQAITIDGGTGRFASATGSAIAVGETAGDFSTYFGAIDGSIEF